MKQTAVEWLVEQVNSDCLNSTFIRPDMINQAKVMEKEQTLLFSEKYDEYVFRGGSATAEEYYEETFKSE
jgi:hypothetical protein